MAETAVQDKIKELFVRACRLNNFNNDSNFNANDRNVDNSNNRLRGIAPCHAETLTFKMYKDLWQKLCGYENLELAYQKARRHKTTRDYVLEFEKELKTNLLTLSAELLLHCYKPKPLVNFIIRDPKTRKISKSDFRDRVIHHALCNVIEPIFDKGFIYDSYANRKFKGTLKAVERFDCFKRKVSHNNTKECFVLKADVRKYFETVDHDTLLNILKKQINDKRIIWLIKQILNNISSGGGELPKGMPLGNLTSQFFANVYLNELDQFVKHKLKAKYYLRYVDDFVILHENKEKLEEYKNEINSFLKQSLKIELHPDKSKIINLGSSITFLGFRVFYYHRLLKKQNIANMKRKFDSIKEEYYKGNADYDKIYDFMEGWIAYAKKANTYNLRNKLLADFDREFQSCISTKEINRGLKASMIYS